jgi:hypothetical protein
MVTESDTILSEDEGRNGWRIGVTDDRANTSDTFSAGREFIYREGRLLERRLFAVEFEGAPPQGVLDALGGYRNSDGGFGHGLEPDKLCPESQPLDVQFALQTMDAAGAIDAAMLRGALDFLVPVSGAEGGAPVLLPSILGYPHAAHWGEWAFPAGLNPTAGIVGLLYKHGVEHPWLGPATEFCWTELSRGLPEDAHTISVVLTFLEFVPDRERAEALIPAVTGRLEGAAFFRSDPAGQEYGLSPLNFAPTPSSPWRRLFSDEVIEAFLNQLQADQQPDGGWPVAWEPPGQASLLAWRGHETLRALRTLRAYGRL